MTRLVESRKKYLKEHYKIDTYIHTAVFDPELKEESFYGWRCKFHHTWIACERQFKTRERAEQACYKWLNDFEIRNGILHE